MWSDNESRFLNEYEHAHISKYGKVKVIRGLKEILLGHGYSVDLHENRCEELAESLLNDSRITITVNKTGESSRDTTPEQRESLEEVDTFFSSLEWRLDCLELERKEAKQRKKEAAEGIDYLFFSVEKRINRLEGKRQNGLR